MDHSTTEWIGTEGVNLEGQFVLGAGYFPAFAPEKGSKAIFPCQGKVKNEIYIWEGYEA